MTETFYSIAKDHGGVFQHVASYLTAATKDMEPILGENDPGILIISRNGEWDFCTPQNTWGRMGLKALAKLEDQTFFSYAEKENLQAIRDLENQARFVLTQDLRNMSLQERISLWQNLFTVWRRMNIWGHFGNLLDFEHFAFSNRIQDFVMARAKSVPTTSAQEAIAVLTTPLQKSPIQQQDSDLLKLLEAMQQNPQARAVLKKEPTTGAFNAFPDLQALLDHHVATYDWIQFSYDGPTIVDEYYFLANLSGLEHQGIDARRELQKLVEEKVKTQKLQDAYVQKLGLSQSEQYWLKAARTFMYLKAYRKDAVYLAQRSLDPFFRDIARRLMISPTQARQIAIEEMPNVLASEQVDVNALNNRWTRCAMYITNGGTQIFTGEEAVVWEKKVVQPIVEDVNEFQGSCAYPGRLHGTVKIVVTEKDMQKLLDGEILVSPATNPHLLPAMKRAAGFITDEGGITCHAAIVSRELKKPCVIGTKIATRVLKDGDIVEVDAEKGIVKKIN